MEVADGAKYLMAKDRVLYSKDGKNMYLYPSAKKDKIFFIPKGTAIKENRMIAKADARVPTSDIPPLSPHTDFFILNGSNVFFAKTVTMQTVSICR